MALFKVKYVTGRRAVRHKVTIFWGYFCPLDSRSKHQTNDSTMSESKMLNVPSRVVFVKEPPEDLSTEEMERKFSKFRGFVALRRFPNRAFVEFRSIEEASHFLHVMREEPITKNGPICRIYYDKDNGFDPTRAPSRKRKAGDSMDRDRDPHWDRGQGHYPDQVYERYEDYYRPSKYRRSEHDPAAPRGDRSPRDRSRDRSRERHREDEKKEERNDRQKERPDDERDHYDRAPRDDHSPSRDREDQRRSRGEDHNGDYNHRRDRPREYMPREHVPREHSQSHDRPRSDRDRSPERNGARDREYQSRDRPSNGYYEERERPRFIDPVHWERTVLPFFQDMGITSYNVERVPNYQASSTLYVNNLPPDATERELTNLFRFIPNFVQVRMIHKEGKNSFCFVDFRDPDSAYVARSLLQGYRMDSRGGIHIEYDKGRK